MRAFGTFLVIVAAGIFTYTIVLPAVVIIGLVVLLLGFGAALGFGGAVMAFLYWLALGDPAALSAALKCAVWGCVCFLPSFIGGYHVAGAWLWVTTPKLRTLHAPFIEPVQRSIQG